MTKKRREQTLLRIVILKSLANLTKHIAEFLKVKFALFQITPKIIWSSSKHSSKTFSDSHGLTCMSNILITIAIELSSYT